MNTSSNAVDYTFGEVYKNMRDQVGEASPLLQTFVLSNNTDIIKAIEYWKAQITGPNDPKAVEINSHIKAYEDIMLQRLSVTQDLFSFEAPASPVTFKMGPKTVEDAVVVEEVTEVKTIEHPASKMKKTINEKLKEDAERQKKDQEEEAKATPVVPLPPAKSTYERKYPTEKERLTAINSIIPKLEEDIKKDKDSALRRLRFHLRNYGENVPFCEDDQMTSLLYWIEHDNFKHVSPLNILLDKDLSITDIVTEATKLVKEKNMTKGQVIDHLRPYVLDNKLAEQEEDEIIRTEEEYNSFCSKSILFLFDENGESESPVSRDEIKEQLYEIHKEKGKKTATAMAKDFRDWLREQRQKSSLKSAYNEVLEFIKSKNTDEPAEEVTFEDVTTGSKNLEKGEEVEEAVEVDGPAGKVDITPIKTRFPKLEDLLKHKDSKKELQEFLITIVNKHIAPIGVQEDGMDAKIEGLTHLARKRFLEMGVKDHDDFTEQDVSQFIAQEVVPFITDDYTILSSSNEEEFKVNLTSYLEKYPAGKEKERKAALTTVANSDIPRDNFVKPAMKKIRRGNFNQVNEIFAEINKDNNEKKKNTKTK